MRFGVESDVMYRPVDTLTPGRSPWDLVVVDIFVAHFLLENGALRVGIKLKSKIMIKRLDGVLGHTEG